ILMSEISPYQQLPAGANLEIGEQKLPDLVETDDKEIANPLVPAAKLQHHLFEQAFDIGFGKGHDAGDNFQHPLFIVEFERSENDPRIIRPEDYSRTFNVHY